MIYCVTKAMLQKKLAVLFLAMVTSAGFAALKPVETTLAPEGGKSVAVFKTTPQGELKIHLYFPTDWKASDRRPAIVFFLWRRLCERRSQAVHYQIRISRQPWNGGRFG